jgi:hypothetical protein
MTDLLRIQVPDEAGWRVDYKYLNAIEDHMVDNGEPASLEQIEAVILAIAAINDAELEAQRAQPQVEPVATVTGYKQITPALVIGTKLYAAPVVALPQVELLEIIRTARAYIGILEANEPDAVAKAFLAELYNKMTEAIKPILP